eukprot:353851-Chlamydomonas_euryale.AAC.7
MRAHTVQEGVAEAIDGSRSMKRLFSLNKGKAPKTAPIKGSAHDAVIHDRAADHISYVGLEPACSCRVLSVHGRWLGAAYAEGRVCTLCRWRGTGTRPHVAGHWDTAACGGAPTHACTRRGSMTHWHAWPVCAVRGEPGVAGGGVHAAAPADCEQEDDDARRREKHREAGVHKRVLRADAPPHTWLRHGHHLARPAVLLPQPLVGAAVH